MTDRVHPAAAVFPMLPDDELQALADDIAANGLLHPIVTWIDPERPTPWKDEVILDGRNRLAACERAGVTPTFVPYEGDPVAFVLSANVARRHMTTGARAMATAVVLAADGKRRDGKWSYGALANDRDSDRSGWRDAMAHAGLVLDVTPEVAPAVVSGAVSLHAAHSDAQRERQRAHSYDARLAKLPDDLAGRVREEDWPLSEAEAAHRQRETDRRDRIQRNVDYLRRIAECAELARTVRTMVDLDDALAQLTEDQRQLVLHTVDRLTKPETTP